MKKRYRQVSSAPIRDENGKIMAAVAVARDVTQQKKVEQDLKDTLKKLEKSNADLKEFAYVASHDLKGTFTYDHQFFTAFRAPLPGPVG